MLQKALLGGRVLFAVFLIVIATPSVPQLVMATDGNIEPERAFAWAENVGWINFKPSQGPGVTVSGENLSGFAWGENIGWIVLDPKCTDGSDCGGVQNDRAGRLSGYAWGENVGWINFAPSNDGISLGGVVIDNNGRFHGAAWGENIGWISFDYAGSDTSGVVTSWHPASGPPVITLLGSSPMNVEIGTTFSDPGATAVDSLGNDLTSSVVATGSVDTSALGSYTITYTVTNANGLTATIIRNVNVVDTIAPAVTASASVAGAPYAPGTWVNSDVLVTFFCSDSGSGVDSVTGPVTVGTEGKDQSVIGTCRDKSGNSTDATFSGVLIDKTAPNPPTITLSPSPNRLGWNRSDVSVTFTSNDDAGTAQSGVAACSAPVNISSETAVTGTTVSGTCTDRASNISLPTTTTVKLDKTAPVVSITGVADGANYSLGAVPIAECSTSDALSGVAASATLSIAGGTANGVGSFTATCAGAIDVAGSTAPPVNVTYYVGYKFVGFLPPLIAGEGSYSGSFKLGRAIPVKWQLTNAQGGYIFSTDAAALSSVKSLRVAFRGQCTVDPGDPTDPGTSGSSELRYDAAANQFIYNWDTSGLTKGCYDIQLALEDNGPIRVTTVNLKP